MKISHSFSKRLSIYILTLAATLFVITIFVVGAFSRSILIDEAEEKVTNLLDATIGDIESILSNIEAATLNSVWIVKENLDDAEYIATIPEHLVKENPYIIGSTVAFIPNFYESKGKYYAPYTYIEEATGKVHSVQMGNENYEYTILDWFLIPSLLKKPWWSEPYYDDGGGGQMMITYSVPILNEDNEVFAVLTADVNLKALTKYAEAIKPYKESYVMLISANASFISNPDTASILKESIFSTILSLKKENPELMELGKSMVEGETGIGKFVDDDGIKCFAAYGPVMNGWSMAIVCKYQSVLEKLNTMGLVLALVLIIGLALLVFITQRIISRLTEPLYLFSNSAREIAQGNFNAKLPEIHSKDEMLQLHNSFEYMQTSLTNYISELQTVTAAKQRIESELSIARDIQLGMVPKNFSERVHAFLFPAKEVGGDLYDFIEKDGCFYFAIGDVSGKGIPAALYMAITRSSFRYLANQGLNVKDVVCGMNTSVSEGNDTDMFVTFFVGKLHLDTGLLEYCNAGHNSIIIVNPDGTANYLRAKANMVGGVFNGFDYQDEQVQLHHGSHLVLYTDGVTEAEKENKDQYGEERLLSLVNNINKNSVMQITEDILTDVRKFTDGAEQNDDITIMTVKY